MKTGVSIPVIRNGIQIHIDCADANDMELNSLNKNCTLICLHALIAEVLMLKNILADIAKMANGEEL